MNCGDVGLAPLLAAAAPHVDAHALDIYAFTPGVHFTRGLYAAGGHRPFIVAEFSFQGTESFVKHPARQVRNDPPAHHAPPKFRKRSLSRAARTRNPHAREMILQLLAVAVIDSPED